MLSSCRGMVAMASLESCGSSPIGFDAPRLAARGEQHHLLLWPQPIYCQRARVHPTYCSSESISTFGGCPMLPRRSSLGCGEQHAGSMSHAGTPPGVDGRAGAGSSGRPLPGGAVSPRPPAPALTSWLSWVGLSVMDGRVSAATRSDELPVAALFRPEQPACSDLNVISTRR